MAMSDTPDPEERNATESAVRDPVSGVLSASCRTVVQNNALNDEVKKQSGQ